MLIINSKLYPRVPKDKLGKNWTAVIQKVNPNFVLKAYSVVGRDHFDVSAYLIQGKLGNTFLKKMLSQVYLIQNLAMLDIYEIWFYNLSRERKVPFRTCRLWTTDHLCHNAPPDWESSRQLGSKVIFPNLVMVRCAAGDRKEEQMGDSSTINNSKIVNEEKNIKQHPSTGTLVIKQGNPSQGKKESKR
ncbi:hypothetical protein AGLY_015365 [Aphis glycines]|uniref:Uncharacterized protein n=1 Tax=Aphis glycines TaxID=307491 RepID=A0A6G0T114_APHGL|nr:hypothetical protein AGLY_015365 [Aphis glycines]